MASLTGIQLIAEVRWNLGQRTDFTDSRILRFLNLAQSRLARVFDFRELERVSVGQVGNNPYIPANTATLNVYDLVSPDMDSIIEIRRADNGNRVNNLLPLRQNLDPQPPPEWWPVEPVGGYLHTGSQISFFTTPSDDIPLIIRWKKTPTTLEEGETSELIGRDDVLIAMATSWAAGSARNMALEKEWMEKTRALMELDMALLLQGFDAASRELIFRGIVGGHASG